MRRKHIGRIAGCLLIFLIAGPGNGKTPVPDYEINSAAQKGMGHFLNKIPDGYERYYGFDSRSDFKWTSLGEPYRIYSLSVRKRTDEPKPGRDFLVRQDVWRFPLVVEGKMRSLLTVAEVAGNFKAVEIGGAGLSEELDELEKTFDSPGGQYQKALVRIYSIKADLISLWKEDQAIEEGMFIPLQSARNALGLGKDGLIIFTYEDLLSLLKTKWII